jgi:hypothetical protein
MPRFRLSGAFAMAFLPAMVLSPNATKAVAHRAVLLTPAWHLVVNRHYGRPANASGYSEILTAGQVIWAFGGTNPGGQSSPVAVYRARDSWQSSALPRGLPDFINSASASGPSDIWAVSGYGRYILHWDGRRWHLARRWRQGGALSGVAAVSHQDVWVFGTSAYGVQTIGTWHFDGRSWTADKGVGQDVYRASAVSGRDIWGIAAGRHSDSIERFGRRGWRHVRTGRILVGVRWRDILAASANDVWVLGNAADRQGSGRLVLAHWNGRRWTRITTALDAWAGQLATAGPGRVVATATSPGLLGNGIVLELTSTGHLASTSIASSLGSGVSDVVFAPRSRVLWASGGILTRLGGNAAVWNQALPHQPRRSRRGAPDID